MHTKFRRWLISLASLSHLSDTLSMANMKLTFTVGFAGFFAYQILVAFLSTGVL